MKDDFYFGILQYIHENAPPNPEKLATTGFLPPFSSLFFFSFLFFL